MGQPVTSGQSFGTAYGYESIKVVLTEFLVAMRQIRPAVSRKVTIHGHDRTYQGTVSRVSAELDDRCRDETLYVAFDDPNTELPGAFVSVVMYGRTVQDAVELPERVLREGSKVRIVKNGVLHEESITIIGRSEGVQVANAFNLGSGVVVNSPVGAHDGMAIEIRSAAMTETEVPVATVVNLVESRRKASILRVDGSRAVRVKADVDANVTTRNAVMAMVERTLLPDMEARFTGTSIAKAGFSRDEQKDLADLARLGLVPVMLIFVFFASQLRSYAQPLIILLAVPMGAAGAILGHLVLNFDLLIVSIIGIVALSGWSSTIP